MVTSKEAIMEWAGLGLPKPTYPPQGLMSTVSGNTFDGTGAITSSASTTTDITIAPAYGNAGGYLPESQFAQQQQMQRQYNRETRQQLEYARPICLQPPTPKIGPAVPTTTPEPEPETALAWLDSEIDRIRVRL